MNTLSALIIENRPLPNIVEIIERHEKFLPKDCEIYWIKNEPIHSIRDYNRLLTSKRLWRNISTEKVLIFQWDSELWRTGVEDFLEFDFCGANIKNIPSCMNGGLSIRDSKAMLKIINHFSYEGEQASGNEDIWYVNCLRQLQSNLPTREEAAKFSVETELTYGSCGGHAIEKYLTPSECQSLRNQYL